MHYVYLINNIVIDQAQVNPFNIFKKEYAEQFIEAPDEVTFGWKLDSNQWVPPPPPIENYKQKNKVTASQLLFETDWIDLPSVVDPEQSNPYLMNKSDFLSYRNQLRAIAINPPETEISEWPVKPNTVWSS